MVGILNRQRIGTVGLLFGLYLAPAVTIGAECARARNPGDVFKDCSVCPEMVVIPSGRFRMGGQAEGGLSWESPAHEVRIDYRFAVGRFEVTFAEWDACVSDGGCKGYLPDDRGWDRGNLPVIDVSWLDAKNYVNWLSRKTDQKYRLLSEAEWEYAARAGAITRYSWGKAIGTGNANCSGCGGKWDDTKPDQVGHFRPNEFGLYDMHGNVWEWVEDCWHDNYEGAPVNGSPWVSGGACRQRVMRGGAWVSGPRNHSAAARSWDGDDFRLMVNGFRVARSQ